MSAPHGSASVTVQAPPEVVWPNQDVRKRMDPLKANVEAAS